MKIQLARIGCLVLIGFLAFAQPVYSATNLDSGIREIGQQISKRLADKNMKKVAVAEFTQLDGSVTAFGQFFAEELITSLFSIDPEHLEAVERRQLQKALDQERISPDNILDAGSLRKIAGVLNIDSVITGSIADLGDSVRINVRALSVENARIFGAASTNIEKNDMIARLLSQNASSNNRPARFSGNYQDDRNYRGRQGYSQNDRYYDSRNDPYDRRHRGSARNGYDDRYEERRRGNSRYEDERYNRPYDRPRRGFAREDAPQSFDNQRTARVEVPPQQPPQLTPQQPLPVVKPEIEEPSINPEIEANIKLFDAISVRETLSRIEGHQRRSSR